MRQETSEGVGTAVPRKVGNSSSCPSGELSSHLLWGFGACRLAERDVSARIEVWTMVLLLHVPCGWDEVKTVPPFRTLSTSSQVTHNIRHSSSDHKALVTEILTHWNFLFTKIKQESTSHFNLLLKSVQKHVATNLGISWVSLQCFGDTPIILTQERGGGLGEGGAGVCGACTLSSMLMTSPEGDSLGTD